MKAKDKIMKISFSLFLKKGFSEVSVNDILEKSESTKGGFYHYFKSKEELIKEVVRVFMYPFFELPIKKIRHLFQSANRPLTAKEKLQEYYNQIHCVNIAEEMQPLWGEVNISDFYYLVCEGSKKYEYLSALRLKIYNEKIKIFEEILEQGKKEGIIDQDIDSHQWAITINASRDGIVFLNLMDHSIDINEKCKISFEQMLEEISKEADEIGGANERD